MESPYIEIDRAGQGAAEEAPGRGLLMCGITAYDVDRTGIEPAKLGFDACDATMTRPDKGC